MPSVEERIGKRTEFIFKLLLVVWIIIMNTVLHIIGYPYTWVIFACNIMMFTMEGEFKTRFLSAEIGGLVGLVLSLVMLISIGALQPVIGELAGFLIPLAVAVFLLVIGHDFAPLFLNNVGFMFLVCATIDVAAFAGNLKQHFIGFVIGSLIFNLVSLALMKPAQAIATKQILGKEQAK